jgi:site-specific DNA-cytosine methylase
MSRGFMNGISLFSGIGGIDVALSDYVRTRLYCELDPYCQGVLLSRMADGHLDNAPIWDDIKTLSGKEWGAIDIIFGGFP